MSFLKFSSFVSKYKKNNKIALFNNLNRELISLSESDYKIIEDFISLYDDIREIENFKDLNVDETIIANLQHNFHLLLTKRFIINKYENENMIYDNYCKSLEKNKLNKSLIQVLYIFPSLKCNFNCKYCIIEHNVKNEFQEIVLNYDTAIKGIELFFYNSNPNQKKRIIFYGGEPLLYKDLFVKIVEYLESKFNNDANEIDKQLEIIINTNGSLLDDKLGKFLSDKNYINLSISLDGCEEDNDKMRVYKNGKGTFKDTIKGIKVAKKYNLNLGVSFTIGKHNIKKLANNVKFVVENLGINGIGFNFMRDFEIGENPASYENNEVEKIIDKVIAVGGYLFREKNILEDKTFMRRWNVFNDISLNNCYLSDCAGMGNQIVLSPYGKVGPCHAFIGTGKYFIDIEDSDMNLNNHSLWRRWKKLSPITKDKCLENKCKEIDFCGGGCPFISEIKKGKLEELEDFACIFVKKLKEYYVWERLEATQRCKNK